MVLLALLKGYVGDLQNQGFYDAVCIFCNKVKFQKGSKSREKLTQAVQLRADKTLRECAIQNNGISSACMHVLVFLVNARKYWYF